MLNGAKLRHSGISLHALLPVPCNNARRSYAYAYRISLDYQIPKSAIWGCTPNIPRALSQMIGSNVVLLTILLIDMAALLFYNISGMCVTGEQDS